MRYVGVDIGLNGAIGYIDSEAPSPLEAHVFDMPVYAGKKKKCLDETGIIEQIKEIGKRPSICCIEYQQTYPKQGVVSAFSLGKQFGFIRGILMSNKISFQTAKPKEWQKEFGITGKDSKKASYAVASALFPKLDFKTERGRILDGRADAILIAEYCRRKIPFAREKDGLVSLFG